MKRIALFLLLSLLLLCGCGKKKAPEPIEKKPVAAQPTNP